MVVGLDSPGKGAAIPAPGWQGAPTGPGGRSIHLWRHRHLSPKEARRPPPGPLFAPFSLFWQRQSRHRQ